MAGAETLSEAVTLSEDGIVVCGGRKLGETFAEVAHLSIHELSEVRLLSRQIQPHSLRDRRGDFGFGSHRKVRRRREEMVDGFDIQYYAIAFLLCFGGVPTVLTE